MILQTPIGRIGFEAMAGGSILSVPDARFSLHDFSPALPQDMAVEKTYAILLALSPAPKLREIVVRCHWLDPLRVDGDPESGEGLDAQSWQADGWIVAIGTEDLEVLQARLPQCGFSENHYPVRCRPQGIDIHIPSMQENLPLTLHFVAAINAYPEPVASSAWFALDVPHQLVLAMAAG